MDSRSQVMATPDEHVNEVEHWHWPSLCPHPLCDLSLKDAPEMQYHLISAPDRPAEALGLPASWEHCTSQTTID